MPKPNRNDVDRFFELGIDLGTRTVVISDYEIDYDTARSVICALHILDHTPGEIVVKMNSGGGNCYHGMAVYDAIRLCNNPVKIVGYGHVMSMALVVLQAGDERVLAENARVMWHYGSDGFFGHAKDLERTAEESKRLRQVHDGILLARIREKQPNFPASELKSRFEFDTYMSAAEAVTLGLADSII